MLCYMASPRTAPKNLPLYTQTTASQQVRRIGRAGSAVMQKPVCAACWRSQPATLLRVR